MHEAGCLLSVGITIFVRYIVYPSYDIEHPGNESLSYLSVVTCIDCLYMYH